MKKCQDDETWRPDVTQVLINADPITGGREETVLLPSKQAEI